VIINNEIHIDYCDVLIRPKRSTLTSRADVDLKRTFTFYWGGSWCGVPVVAANMDSTGTIAIAKEFSKHNMMTCLSKHLLIDNINESLSIDEKLKISISIGMSEKSRGFILNKDLDLRNIPFICIDVANGYTQKFFEYIKEVRDFWGDKIIIAGNVATSEMTEALILAGADIVKIGIGPGSACTTRKIAGVGVPQLSAVIACADAAHGLGGHIMADGGCTCPGDIVKSFGGGADFSMVGGMLSGHDESGGEEVYDKDGVITHKEFYGMSSDTAMDKYHGGVAVHRTSEGRTVKVPYRGQIKDTIQDILGGLRSACTYCGAKNIKSLSKCCTFLRVSRQLNTVFED